jgi:non-specific serine/threonine protein kinase
MDHLAGRTLGPYELGELLGSGGYGAVYRATHRRLRVAHAVKVLTPSALLSGGDLVKRFEREAHTAAQLRHPNIVQIHDIAEEAGFHYIAMELVEGMSLREVLRAQGPLPLGRALRLLSQLADALDYAHGRGVLHRDLKPANVVVGPDDHATLVDFGLARPVEGTRLTRTIMVVGTAEYMAPEAVEGDRGSPSSDLYALGVLAYEMLAGESPFAGREPLQVLYAQVHTPPPSPRGLRPDLPEAVEAALLRQLAKDPARRYPSGRAFVAGLSAAADATAEMAPPGGAARAREPAAAVPSNLRAQLTSFVGREREVAEVERLLSATRLLTLTGAGGCGKTRLALAVAADSLDDFPDGAFFVDLSPLPDPDLVAPTIVRGLGLQEVAGRPPADLLRSYLRDKRSLLVLDNFERLLAAARLVAELLAASPDLRMLVTSREPLRVPGEREFAVPPLATPGAGRPPPAEALARYEAVRLFVERAQAVRPDFTVTNASAPAVAEICRQLDGIPLAIELAAARVKAFSVEQIRARLDDRFRLLTTGARTAPARQQTLRAVVDWSYDLLAEAERLLFDRLSVFAGGFALEAAEAVCAGDGIGPEDVLELLSRLVDKSLVQAEAAGVEGELRYRLLETLRAYGRERLAGRGEADRARRRHAAYMVGLAERAERAFHGPEEAAWLRRAEREHDNVRAALQWAVECGDEEAAEVGLRLAGALGWSWNLNDRWSEACAWYERVLGLPGAMVRTPARAKALVNAGALAVRQGDYPTAGTWLEESLSIALAIGDELLVIWAVSSLSLLVVFKGGVRATQAFEAAVREVGDPLAYLRRVGSPWHEARALQAMAEDSLRRGDNAEAAARLEEAVRVARAAGDAWSVATCLNHLGDVLRSTGDHERAGALYEESLALFRGLGYGGEASLLHNLGYVALARGERQRAAALFREAVTVFRRTDERRGVAECLVGLAGVAAVEGRAETAARLFGAGEAALQARGTHLSPSNRADYERNVAAARVQMGEEAFAAAWAKGQAMSLEQAIAFASEEHADT